MSFVTAVVVFGLLSAVIFFLLRAQDRKREQFEGFGAYSESTATFDAVHSRDLYEGSCGDCSGCSCSDD